MDNNEVVFTGVNFMLLFIGFSLVCFFIIAGAIALGVSGLKKELSKASDSLEKLMHISQVGIVDTHLSRLNFLVKGETSKFVNHGLLWETDLCHKDSFPSVVLSVETDGGPESLLWISLSVGDSVGVWVSYEPSKFDEEGVVIGIIDKFGQPPFGFGWYDLYMIRRCVHQILLVYHNQMGR